MGSRADFTKQVMVTKTPRQGQGRDAWGVCGVGGTVTWKLRLGEPGVSEEKDGGRVAH